MDTNFEQYEQDVQDKPVDWRELYEKYIVYWKWVVASMIVALFIGFFYSRKQQNMYEVNASVLVVDQSKNGGINEMSMLKQLDAVGLTSSPSMVNDEDQVMHSTALMKRVVAQLELYTTYSHSVFLKKEDLYTSSPLYVKLDSAELADLTSAFTFSAVPDNGKLLLEGNYCKESFKKEVTKLPAKIETPAGMLTIELRAGSTFPEEEIDITINNPNKVAKYYVQNALTTEVSRQVSVINLTLQTNNIQKGQDVLNTLMTIYNQDAIEQVNRSAINTASFIDSRMKILSGELSDVEQNVENYKQANHLTDISADAQLYLDKSTMYYQQRVEVETQLHLIDYVEEFLNNPANKNAMIPNLGLTDVGLVAAIEQYNNLIMTRDRIAGATTNENPTLKTLTDQVKSLRKGIMGSIANTRKGLQISNNDLNVQNNLAQSKIQNIPRQEREFIEIKRQQQVKESLYLFLLQKREEASLTMAVTVPKGRVLNTPDDAVKVGPHTTMIMLVFLLVGLFIPILIIFLRDITNTTIVGRSQVEKLTTVPIIGELGHNTTNEIIIDHKSHMNSNAELFRLLRTKLKFILDHPAQNVIMVTSTEPGEGKTFVSMNLAINLSLTEKKVLLIGLDLRKPQLSKYFNIKEANGITSYLSGLVTDYKSLIITRKDHPSLDILPAGIIPPNPNELMMKKKMDDLIDELKSQYDYIVIDTPPVGAVSDSLLLDRLVDITLYVCRAGYSDKRNIEFLNHIQAEGTLSRPYLLINDLDMESKHYYRKGYSYGYGKYYGHKQQK